ncbi:MAG: Nif3-like dinuclear metal center hexameric protein [Syntrophobacteraceae bacterium]
MVRVKDILAWIDDYAPFRYAESWDRCGLQVGDPQARVERVLVALDPGTSSIEEAQRLECQCLVSHHPLIFRPLNTVREDRFPECLVIRALKAGIHLIAAHTNLDASRGGTNELLSEMLSLDSHGPLEVNAAWRSDDRYAGMGRMGVLPEAMSLDRLSRSVQKALGGIDVRVVGRPEQQVELVALCTGSGGGLLERAIEAGADAYVSGDIKYHEAQRAVEAGLGLIDVGHYASEKPIVELLASYLRSRSAEEGLVLDVVAACDESDPFRFYQVGTENREESDG